MPPRRGGNKQDKQLAKNHHARCLDVILASSKLAAAAATATAAATLQCSSELSTPTTNYFCSASAAAAAIAAIARLECSSAVRLWFFDFCSCQSGHTVWCSLVARLGPARPGISVVVANL
jgi:hypothetical protein